MVSDSTVKSIWFKDWVLIFCIVLLAMGVAFRFGNLNQVYWHDEAYTSLRMSGYSALEVNRTIFNGKLSTLDDLMYYQWPTQERSLLDTVRSLAIDDSQHPPMYYILVRQWVAGLGETVWITRSLSAVVSLLAFPAVAWLWQELFALSEPTQHLVSQRRWTIALSIMLLAISPLHILYAQEAREYALWTVLTLGSSAMLLRAMRLNTLRHWALYSGLLVASFYTHPFTGFVAIGHGAYGVLVGRCRPTRRAIACLLAVAFGALAFSPWLSILINSWAITGASWTARPLPLVILLQSWGVNIARAFIVTPGDFGFDSWQVYVTLPISLVLIGYAFYFLCRHTPVRVWLFVLLLVVASSLPLVLPDLILGGQRSTSPRYLVPVYLGIQLAIAFLLAAQICQRTRLKRHIWRGVTVFFVTLGLWSGVTILTAETSWTKGINYSLPSLSRLVNESPKPLLISSSQGINMGTVFALAYLLDPKIQLLLIDGWQTPDSANIPDVPPGFSDVFLLNPSEAFRNGIEQRENTQASLVFNDFHLFLWKLAS